MQPAAPPEERESTAPQVTVLVVSHNSVDALRSCLAALEQSKERDRIELMVVDNGSTDGCQSIDAEFPDITILRLPHHCGLAKARNIGLRTAHGECVLFLAPDVVVEPGTVAALAARLAASPEALAVCPTLVDGAGEVVSRAWRLPDAARVRAAWRDPWSMAETPPGESVEVHDGKAILLRKVTIQGINYFDKKYGEHWIDVDLACQIRRAGKKILLAPDIRAGLNGDNPLWKPESGSDRAAFAADAAAGAARYLGKYFGLAAGIAFRAGLVLATLGRVLVFQDVSCNASLLTRLLNGYRIDGTSQRL